MNSADESRSGHVVLTTQIPTSPPRSPAKETIVHRLSAVRNNTSSARSTSPTRPDVVSSQLSTSPSAKHMAEYVHLLESRLQELDPKAPLPLNPIDIPSSRPPSNPAPILTKNVPSYILSSTARWESRVKELQRQLNLTENNLKNTEEKGKEVRRQNLELRRLCERYESEEGRWRRRVKELESGSIGIGIGCVPTSSNTANGKKPAIPTSINDSKRVNVLEEEVSKLKKTVKDMKLIAKEKDIQALVLEDALDLRAEELGLVDTSDKTGNNGRAILKQLATLKGDNRSLHSSLKDAGREELRQKNLIQSLVDENKKLIAKHQRVLSDCTKLEDTLRRSKEGKISQDLERTEDEKNALLEYVEESLSCVEKLERERDGLKERVSEIIKLENEVSDLKSENEQLKKNGGKIRDQNEILSGENEKMKSYVSARDEEIDELSRMQVELLNRLRETGDETEEKTSLMMKAKEDLRERTTSATSSETALKETNRKLVETESLLQQTTQKLNSAIPKLEGAEAELCLLRRKCDELENVEEENNMLKGEVAQLRPVWERLEAVRGELEVEADMGAAGESSFMMCGGDEDQEDANVSMRISTAITNANSSISRINAKSTKTNPNKKAIWLSDWVKNNTLNLLLPSLGDRVKSLHSDLINAENQVHETTSIIQREREEREAERRVLTETVVNGQQENKELTSKVRELSSEAGELRRQQEKAREAEAAMGQLKMVWLTHCREEKDNSNNNNNNNNNDDDNDDERNNMDSTVKKADSEIVSAVSRALFGGRTATVRLDHTLKRLVESEAMVNLKNREVARLQEEGQEILAKFASSVSSGEAEVAALSSESTALAAELESAAELAERQGALAITLEGRLESLSKERALLANQLQANKAEMEEYNRDLSSAIENARRNSRSLILAVSPSARSEVGLLNESYSNLNDSNASFGQENHHHHHHHHHHHLSMSSIVRTACKMINRLSETSCKLNEKITEMNRNGDCSRHKIIDIPEPLATPGQGNTTDENVNVSNLSSSVPAAMSVATNTSTVPLSSKILRQKNDLARLQEKFLGGGGFHKTTEGKVSAPAPMPLPTPPLPTPAPTQIRPPIAPSNGNNNVSNNRRPPSPATAQLQERLRRAQQTFASLRKL